jgi:hypothetical protein
MRCSTGSRPHSGSRWTEGEDVPESWGKSWRRILKAEYESTCFVCRRAVNIGHAIVYDGQRWIHVRCAES